MRSTTSSANLTKETEKTISGNIYSSYISDSEITLLDISSCKCIMVLNCNCQKSIAKCICSNPIDIKCSCPIDRKIPVIERKFLYAQRCCGIGKIEQIDRKESEKLAKRVARKEKSRYLSGTTAGQSQLSLPSSSSLTG